MRTLAAFVWIAIYFYEAQSSNSQVSFDSEDGVRTSIAGKPFKGGLKQSHKVIGSLLVPTMKGCAGSKLKTNASAPTNSNGRIFLVQRGGCLFFDKAINAQTQGANAVIIYNDASHTDNVLFSLSCGKSDEINIPAMMVSHGDGLLLLDALKSGNLIVNISAFSSPQCTACEHDGKARSMYCALGLWRLDSYMWEISVGFALTMVVVVLLLRWSRGRLARLMRNGQADGLNAVPKLTDKQVDAMERVTWHQDEELGEQTSCCICLENFVDAESLVVMPCPGRHAFHSKCIKNWLLNHSTKCPLCKFDVANDEAQAACKDAPDEDNEANISLVVGPTPNLDAEGTETPLLRND